MGRGDRRTRRGKIFKGSFGNTRPRKKEGVVLKKAAPAVAKPTRPKRKPPTKQA